MILITSLCCRLIVTEGMKRTKGKRVEKGISDGEKKNGGEMMEGKDEKKRGGVGGEKERERFCHTTFQPPSPLISSVLLMTLHFVLLF